MINTDTAQNLYLFIRYLASANKFLESTNATLTGLEQVCGSSYALFLVPLKQCLLGTDEQ